MAFPWVKTSCRELCEKRKRIEAVLGLKNVDVERCIRLCCSARKDLCVETSFAEEVRS